MATDNSGSYSVIWDGTGRPDVLSYTKNVVAGTSYQFRHKALNFNGASLLYSTVLSTYACSTPSAPGTP